MIYAIIIGAILLLGIALYFKESKIVIDLVGKTVIEVEQELNGAKGQEKLELAVTKIREKLPSYISIFITKGRLIDLIEFMLGIINNAFGINYKPDIKGNEADFDIKIDTKDTYSVELQYDTNEKIDEEAIGLNIYGKLKAETDFKGRNSASIEIGFQKKL